MVKRILMCLPVLLAVTVLLTACTAPAQDTDKPAVTIHLTPTPEPPDAPPPPGEIISPPDGGYHHTEDPDSLYHATVEYGEPDLITDNTGPLWAYIRFPTGGSSADTYIAEWANEIYRNSKDELDAQLDEFPDSEGEVNIHFDSYLIDDGFAGVIEDGMFITSYMAHPIGVVKTFNIDTVNGRLLENEQILDYTQLDTALELLRDSVLDEYPDVADFIEKPDETWLKHIALHHDGIIVILERAMHLPSYLGSVKITLPYDKLGDTYILSRDALQHTPDTSAAPPETPDAPVISNVPPQSGNIDPSKPMVALTFDDGPSTYTSHIHDILEKYNARATFCVVGNLVDARRDTVKRAADLGCEIIGHSWDHRNLSKLTEDEIKQELIDTATMIKSVTGVYPALYRPPYGAVSDTLKEVSAALGFALINWSVDPEDWSSKDADKVYDAIMSDVYDRAIILSHDLYGSTAEAMERVIPKLISEGYQLVTVSELMYYSDKTLVAGNVYRSGK